jgi:putative ABC transport system permease protein
VLEIAFTLALLAGAGVMIRSFMSVYKADLGARVENVLMARLSLPGTRYPDPAARLHFAEQLQERLRVLPGVEHASIATSFPGEGMGTLRLDVEGQPRASAELPREVRSPVVDTAYFGTFGILASEGRLFNDRDGAPGAEAVVVNQRFAEAYFGGESPIGRRIMLRPDVKDSAWASIIGVIPHVRHGDTTSNELHAVVYRPLRMAPPANFGIALRSQQLVATLSSGVRTAVAGLDQDLPVYQIRTMEENLAQQRWPLRIFGTLFVLFAIFGLVLSTIGMYAVTAYSVGQRRREIGLRMALGAQQPQIAWLVLKRGLVQLAIGVPVGLALAHAVTRGMKSLLIGISPGDPFTLGSILLIVAMVTVAACLLPARRAAKLNPTMALRN